MTAVAVLAGLCVAGRASALVTTAGPVYTLPGGGSCALSGTAASASAGGTWTCTGVNTSAHTHVYFGMRVDLNANGNTMTGVAPSGGSVFSTVTGTTATSITYDGSSTTVADQVNGTQTVTNQLVLTTNSGSVVATGGNPAGNGNGAILDLFSLPTGQSSLSFTVTAKINASAPTFALQAALTAYDSTHTPSAGLGEFSKVDLAFYYSDCGDQVVDSPESCDDGVNNGTAGSCCTTTCTFKTNGTACTDDGNVCTTDLCNGASNICQHAPGNAGTTCRPVASGGCDVAETCTGSSSTCPNDAFQLSTFVCRSAANECDIQETCPGNSATCPGDTVKASGTACTDDGNVCTTDLCNGTSGAPACVHAPGNSGTTCRAAANECDNAELCTGSSSTCPNDTVKASGTACTDDGNVCTTDLCNGTVGSPLCVHNPGNAGTTCRAAASGGCDVAETCTGSSSTCPNDAFQLSTFVCRAAANECDLQETCPGNS
ncbi:MAG: hypothetical protein E6J77_25775, partial [Deltaproteobacteria bacterium]